MRFFTIFNQFFFAIYRFMHCELCGRQVSSTRHHLVPKRTNRFGVIRVKYSKTELNSLMPICVKHVTDMCTERELTVHFNSIELLRTHPDIHAFVDWLKDKSDDFSPRLSSRKKI